MEAEAAGGARPARLDSLRERALTLPRRHGGPVVVLLLAVVLGIGLGARLYNSIDHAPLTPDAKGYALIAKSLYEDQKFGSPGDLKYNEVQEPNNYSPGAPLFFAAIYYLTLGVHPLIGRIVVALLGTLAVLFAYLIGRRLAGPVAGLIAAVPVAIYPALLIYNGMLMSEPLAAFTLSAAVLATLRADDRRGEPRAWILPGVLFGVTALIRPEYLVFGGVFALIALFRVRRDAGWRPGFAAAALLVVAFCAPIVPWTIRNAFALHRFVPISTGGGKALYIGTYLPGGGINAQVKVVILKQPVVERYVATHHVEVVGSRGRKKVFLDEVLRFLAARRYPGVPTDEALARMGRHNLRAYLSGHPGDTLHMFAKKAWYMWRKGPLRQMRSDGWILFQRTLVVLGALGLVVLAARRRWEALVVGAPIVGVTLIAMVLLSHPRRSLVLVPLVAALGGAAVVWAVQLVRELIGRREIAVARTGWKPAD